MRGTSCHAGFLTHQSCDDNYCFKPLHLGLICYTAVDNSYSQHSPFLSLTTAGLSNSLPAGFNFKLPPDPPNPGSSISPHSVPNTHYTPLPHPPCTHFIYYFLAKTESPRTQYLHGVTTGGICVGSREWGPPKQGHVGVCAAFQPSALEARAVCLGLPGC